MDNSISELYLDPPQQIIVNNKTFPKIFNVNENESDNLSLNDSCNWIIDNIKSIENDLLEHGALLFRGFPINDIESFHKFLLSFKWDHSVKYQGGGGPRNIVLGPIYNSTDSPPEFKIPFHHEMAYLTLFPEKLIFYCDIEPSENGETPILLSNELYNEINKVNGNFVNKIKEKGVRYIRILCDKNIGGDSLKYQKSWQDIFETTDKEKASNIAKEAGTETIEWLDDGSMKLTTIKFDGIVSESRTGKETWFNAICLLHSAAHKGKNTPWKVVYGDYSTIEDSDVESAMKVLNSMGVATKWKQGDMMIVDNRLALHSRNFFTPPRRILAAFAN